MAIPTDPRPEFANGGDAAYTEPGSGKKSLGWVVGEIPPASYFNWLHRTTYRWINYLANALTASEGDFQLVSGRTVDDQAPFVVNGAPQTKWKKALESRAAGTGINRFGRLYTSADNAGMIFVLNAGWNPTTQLWQLSTASRPAIALILEEGGVRVVAKAASASPWDDNNWDEPAALLSTGNLGTGGDLAANGDLIVGTDATIAGALDVGSITGAGGGTLTIGSAATASGTITTAGGFRLPPTHTVAFSSPAVGRPVILDLRQGHVSGSVSYDGTGYLEASGASTIRLMVPVPRGCSITGASIYAVSPGSENVALGLFRERLFLGDGTWQSDSLRSGGYVPIAGAGLITYTPDQNQGITGDQRCTVDVTLDNGARVRPHVRVVYSTSNPAAYDL